MATTTTIITARKEDEKKGLETLGDVSRPLVSCFYFSLHTSYDMMHPKCK